MTSPAEWHIDKRRFRARLLAWYERHRRDLPWRQDRDPYRVWVSEIMLQQTRVAAVMEHYRNFLRRFPTVEKLAAAREPSVLAAWSGLGYYRRARMMHVAAKKIVNEYGGRFPATAEQLRAFPGIGRYTAAAIASIAFGEPVAVVDGNVERVLGRVVGKNLGNEEVWSTAEEFLSRGMPGDFNQAMMELGATVCLPRAPQCLMCPAHELCRTHGELPQTEKAKLQNKREIYYALDCRNGSVFMVERAQGESLMPGMWELPQIPSDNGKGDVWLKLRHSITVTDYTVRVMQGPAPDATAGRWVPKARLTTLPLTGLARKILRTAKVI
jgi:A/G-specific adenine glycosylase